MPENSPSFLAHIFIAMPATAKPNNTTDNRNNFIKTKINKLEELTIKFAREVLRLFFEIDYHLKQNIYHL